MTEPAINDDALIAQLRADLDAFVGEPGPAPELTVAPSAARPAATDRRPWLLAGVAAATIAVVVTGLVVLAGRDDPDVADTPLPVATMPVPPTPDGWTVLEWGDVRLSLPPDLDPFAGECTTTPDADSIAIDCGADGRIIVSASDFSDVADHVLPRSVNGLTEYAVASATGGSVVFDILELRIRVTFVPRTTADIDAIVDTIGVSSKWRALNEPAPPVPDDWQTVAYQGVTVRVPADWPVAPVAPGLSDPDVCQFVWRIPEGVTLGRGNLDTSTMYCAAPTGLGIPSDGVRLFGAPVDGMTPADTLPALDRVVRGDDGQDVVVRVGFGVDGTIGRTILGSIRGPDGAPPVSPVPTTGPPPTTPSTTPPTSSGEMPVPTTPDGWSVVEWRDVRVSVPAELDPFGTDDRCTREQVGAGLSVTCGDASLDIALVDQPGNAAGADLVNGLRQIERPDACTARRGACGSVELAEIGTAVTIRLATDGDVATAIGSIGVSSKWRVDHEPMPPVPDGWATVQAPGLSLRVPADWSVTELGPGDQRPGMCGFTGMTSGATVAVGITDLAPPCPFAPPTVVSAPADGVWVFELAPGTTDALVGDDPLIDQYVDVDGHRYLVRVGLGGDGTIGRTIVGSLQMSTPAEPPTPTTAPTTATGQEYETIGTVIADGAGVQVCFVVLESLPPQCGSGFALAGFDWDAVDGEQTQGGSGTTPATTWLGDVHVRGVWDESSQSLSVTAANVATDADRALQVQLQAALGEARSAPDYSLPCAPPPGGWDRPATDPTLTSLIERVAALDGYAGAWVDPATWVLTVRMTGDVAAGEAAVAEVYDGPVCVVEARYDLEELGAIERELRSLSSVRVMETSISVDATGERVEGTTILPTPQLQASLDDRYGAGVVRLHAYLLPSP